MSGPLSHPGRPKAGGLFFDKVPGEIRNKIYCFAYNIEEVQVYTNSPFTNNDPKLLRRFSNRVPSIFESLLVNKQFYREASGLIFQHAQFIVPIRIQKTLPLACVSHLAIPSPEFIITLAVKHVNLLQNVRHVVFKIEEESNANMNRGLIDMKPLSEVLKPLIHLERVTVTWATKTACLFSKKSDLMRPTIKNPVQLLSPFEIYQNSNRAVQVMVRGGKICPAHGEKNYPGPASFSGRKSRNTWSWWIDSYGYSYDDSLPDMVPITEYMGRLRSLGEY